ncbi:MAG: hypothetical protein DCC57_19415 [Chloroflexi bacterium]|nr:MAG: hypothetical protein DCC57_19415 [Chloroflexota bacterium]
MATPPDFAGFLGVWELDPSQSVYELGEPPARGRYVLSYDGTYLHFDMDWTTAGGQEMATGVTAIPDRQDHACSNLAVYRRILGEPLPAHARRGTLAPAAASPYR